MDARVRGGGHPRPGPARRTGGIAPRCLYETQTFPGLVIHTGATPRF